MKKNTKQVQPRPITSLLVTAIVAGGACSYAVSANATVCAKTKWANGERYKSQDVIRYSEHNYEAQKTHVVISATWTPKAYPVLWKDLGPCTNLSAASTAKATHAAYAAAAAAAASATPTASSLESDVVKDYSGGSPNGRSGSGGSNGGGSFNAFSTQGSFGGSPALYAQPSSATTSPTLVAQAAPSAVAAAPAATSTTQAPNTGTPAPAASSSVTQPSAPTTPVVQSSAPSSPAADSQAAATSTPATTSTSTNVPARPNAPAATTPLTPKPAPAPAAAPAAPAPAPATGFPKQYFAPYLYVNEGNPQDIASIARSSGVKYFSLAFILAKDGCHAAWGGFVLVSTNFFKAQIDALRKAGGNVKVSFGGAAGRELGAVCNTPAALQAQYQAVIDAYGLTAVDFDVEGETAGNSAENDRRAKAIAGLQATARNRNRPLSVSYTLAVTLDGLTQQGINILKNAISNGVRVDMVNIMTMDYFANGNTQMGQAAISAAKGLLKQLKTLFPGKSDAQLWAMQGNTPMIGINDTRELFTIADANTITNFAQQQGITQTSFWQLDRDKSCPGGSAELSGACSGIKQNPLDFSRVFNRITKEPLNKCSERAEFKPRSGGVRVVH